MDLNKFFPEIKKNFGFGLMRLPTVENNDIDIPAVCEMADEFIGAGFNYFDTAHGYHGGRSERAFRECVAERYQRDKYILTNKLSNFFFHSEKEIYPLFEEQLAACGVEYFDFYLMHAQDAKNYVKYKECRAYETAVKLRDEGKIRHFGLSFHDKAEVLDRILTDFPQVEIVQIQLNYADYADASVDSRRVYEVCEKHNKPVIVMEPVKGGSLAKLPENAQKILDDLRSETNSQMSNASFAIRYAASFPMVCMVLSGMSDLTQVRDNIGFMKDFQPLSLKEAEAVQKVSRTFHELGLVPCTGCRYCVLDNDCPKNIQIPELFSCYNQKNIFNSWNQNYYYGIITADTGKASDCIQCGKCEKICPQHLKIRDLLKQVAGEFERKHE